MVELDDVCKMLSITSRPNEFTLAIVDEFGRGTSTIDGYTILHLIYMYSIALAASVAEMLHRPHMITIFSTHFRSVPQSTEIRGRRVYMSFEEADQKIVFRYKLVEGISPSSFAIAAAKRAGIPENILTEASLIGGCLDTAQMSKLDVRATRLATLLKLLPILE